jgi:MATE family multidrug resistance protein
LLLQLCQQKLNHSPQLAARASYNDRHAPAKTKSRRAFPRGMSKNTAGRTFERGTEMNREPSAPPPGPANRRVLAIAGPAILANSSAPLVGLVDTWAIGHLPGAVHLASVGLGSVIFNYLLWAFGFLRMGTTGLVAQARGQGGQRDLTAEIVRACALALAFGVLLLTIQELILAVSIRALAPPQSVAEITAQYFRIRIWAAPAALLVFAVSGVLFGLGKTRSVLALQLILNL